LFSRDTESQTTKVNERSEVSPIGDVPMVKVIVVASPHQM
jgi:hypothetical protein